MTRWAHTEVTHAKKERNFFSPCFATTTSKQDFQKRKFIRRDDFEKQQQPTELGLAKNFAQIFAKIFVVSMHFAPVQCY